MKVLQICPKPPLPSVDGGCLASYQLSRNIMDGDAELKVLSLATEKHPFLPSEIDPSYISSTNFEAVTIDTSASFLEIGLNLLKGDSIQKTRFYNQEFSKLIHKVLDEEQIDVVVFDGLMTTFYIDDVKKKSRAKLVYRSHNVEYVLFQQMAESEKNPLKSKYIFSQAKRLQLFEENIWKNADEIWSISTFDSVVINNKTATKIQNIPFSQENLATDINTQKKTVFHLGAMDWKPNLEGVNWFLNKVWPHVAQNNKDAKLHLGGKNIENASINCQDETVIIHNEVENADDFYDRYEIMIVPVLSGSGIRIKIIQALSRGKVIVSTKKGAMGIPAINGHDMMICESSSEMAEQLNTILENEELRNNLAKNARKLFEEHFEFHKVSSQVKKRLFELP